MIISHRYKFIFIKTMKTAGTSVEMALSRFCGDGDVITPLTPEDERMKKELGCRGPQNYMIPFRRYSLKDWARLIYLRKRVTFFNHAGAAFIKRHVDENVWTSYFKFSIERNPWDKVISYYFWMNRSEKKASLSSFIRSGDADGIKGFDLYTIRGKVAVDRICRYERLEEEMHEISRMLGLPETIQLPTAKSGYRQDQRHYQEVLNEEDRKRIAAVYRREIAQFDYRWS